MSIAPVIAHEIESRQETVRHFVDEEDLGALLVYSPPMANMWGQTGHVGYLSGWASHDRIVDSALVLPRKGPPSLLVAGLPFMLEQIREVSPIEDLRLVQAVDPNAVAVSRGAAVSGPRNFASETLAILEENGLGGKEAGGRESGQRGSAHKKKKTAAQQMGCVRQDKGIETDPEASLDDRGVFM